MTHLPLLSCHRPDDPLAWHGGEKILCGKFLAEAAELSARLPDKRYVLNLCEDRYHFLVGFAAALMRRQTSLFPPGRAPKILQQMYQEHGDVYCLVDQDEHLVGMETFRYVPSANGGDGAAMPCIPDDFIAALVFTSGTTGRPQPHSKTWGALVTVAKRTAERFALSAKQPASIVATVPPQHMYGLETSIMLPLQSGSIMHSGRPFFPQDVSHALEAVSAPRILVTTPVHIRACVVANISLPSLEFILSATAALPAPLASQTETRFATRVLEIYGCTEVGVIATRRTVEGEAWRTLDGISLRGDGAECVVHSAHLISPFPLNDIVRTRGERQLILLGRKSDLINIAGKRTSLGDLNHKLNEIEGVKDGIFIMPEAGDGAVTRLMAFVVAPACSYDAILAELRLRIDPVFLPRPLYLVDSLPRNEAGKLAREKLLQLIACQDSTQNDARARSQS